MPTDIMPTREAAAISPSRREMLAGAIPADLRSLLALEVVPRSDLDRLPRPVQRSLFDPTLTLEQVLSLLVDWRVLTPFQATRIQLGTTFGLRLGDYRVVDRLAVGGSAVILRGEHYQSRQPVAIKLFPVHGNDAGALARVLHEIRVHHPLRHPNIVSLLDAGVSMETDGRGVRMHYLVMELVPGRDLHRHVRESGPVPVATACRWMIQLAGALEEAQRHQVVHRDIKPANIILGQHDQIKLLDFGLARLGLRIPTLEQGAFPSGTFEFMAPEQFHPPGKIDGRTDLYGLGGVLYWCLTGAFPFGSTGNAVTDLQCRLGKTPSARALNPSVPVLLDHVVGRLLSPLPIDRPDSPAQVMESLGRFV